MYSYLCALKLYKNALFNKKTFQGFIIILISEIRENIIFDLSFNGEDLSQDERTFWGIGNLIRVSNIDSYLIPSTIDEGNTSKQFVVKEKIKHDVQKIDDSTFKFTMKEPSKYLTDYIIKYSKPYDNKFDIWLIQGDFKIEDYASHIFDNKKAKARLDLISLVRNRNKNYRR